MTKTLHFKSPRPVAFCSSNLSMTVLSESSDSLFKLDSLCWAAALCLILYSGKLSVLAPGCYTACVFVERYTVTGLDISQRVGSDLEWPPSVFSLLMLPVCLSICSPLSLSLSFKEPLYLTKRLFYAMLGFSDGNLCPSTRLDWRILTNIRWIALEFGTDSHEAQKMKTIDIFDPLTFLIAPASRRMVQWWRKYSVKVLPHYKNNPLQVKVKMLLN